MKRILANKFRNSSKKAISAAGIFLILQLLALSAAAGGRFSLTDYGTGGIGALNSQVVTNLSFNSLTVGEVKPITFTLSGGSYNEYYRFYFQTSGSTLGYSMSPNGPFTSYYTNIYLINTLNSWTSPTIYVKALQQTAQTFIDIRGDGLAGVTGDFDYISIGAAPPTEPTVALSFDDYSSYDLGVGAIQKVDGTVANFPPTQTTTIQISSNSTALLFSASYNGPYAAALQIPKTTGEGGGGSFSFFVKGMATTLGMTTLPKITACYYTTFCGSTPGIKIYNLGSIKFETYVDTSMPSPNVALDTNPNTGGGLRIFPEKRALTETIGASKRRNVTVTAKLNEPIPNKQIEFKVFDIDDVSTDDPVVDPNGSAGDDNRSSDFYLSATGNLTRTAYTDSSGTARITLTVGQQPGDNYRVAATYQREYAYSNPKMNDASVIGGEVYYNTSLIPEGTANGNQPAVATKRLTVWRRLHIERDSMGAVTNNLVTGTVSGVTVEDDGGSTPATAFTRLALSVTPAVAAEIGTKRFVIGRIYLYSELPNSPSGYFTVYKTSSTSVWVLGLVPQSMINAQFSLWDDDDFNGDDHPYGNGDNGEDIPQPDNGWMQDSDNPSLNKFAAAYVRPTYDLTGNDTNLPFVANVPKADQTTPFPADEEFASLGKFDNSAYRKDEQFWIAYLLTAYQTDARQDNDPFDDYLKYHLTSYVGVAALSYGGLIFPENKSDFFGHSVIAETDSDYTFSKDKRYTPTHETAHLLNTENNDGGFMSKTENAFSNVSLDFIRSTLVPTSGID